MRENQAMQSASSPSIRLLLTAVFLLFILGLSGCETASKPETAADCAKTDWAREGARRVAAGTPMQRGWEQTRGPECAARGWPADRAAFEQAWANGLGAYCQPRNGFALGRGDRRYQGICPAGWAEEFQRAYDMGRVLHQADEDRQSAASKLAQARAAADDTKKTDKEREAARRDIATHQTSRDNAAARITSLEATAAQLGWGIGR